MTVFDPDQLGSASYRNLFANTAGPLRSATIDTVLALDGSATSNASWTSREPLVVVAALAPTAQDVLLTATLADHSPASFGSVRFVAYTEEGAVLPIHRPAVDPTSRIAGTFSLSFTGATLKDDGTVDHVMSSSEIAAAFEVRLLEGVFGRVLFALSLEKARLRREAAQIAAMRSAQYAKLEALDRIGRELGVPRFTDVLSYDATSKQIVAGLGAQGAPVMESDDDYRRRLRIYRPFFQATPQALLDALNGAGNPTDANAGLIAGLGFTKRFTLAESDEALAMTIHLMETGPAPYRNDFLQYVRTNFLVWLEDSPAANAAHDARFIPQEQQTGTDDLRARLRAAYAFPAGAAVAPALAESLDRYASLRTLLGASGQLTIARTQDPTGGSRFELGLGIALNAISAAELDAVATKAADTTRTKGTAGQEALLAGITPAGSAADPDGAWLLQACGFQTVHRVDSATIYLSHLPVYGLMIDGASAANAGADVELDALYQAPGDPGGNAALLAGASAALKAWTAGGNTAWTSLTDADAHTAWQGAPNRAQTDPALGIFRAAGLAAIEQPAPVVASLLALPAEYLTTVRLDATLSAGIVAGHTDAVTALTTLVTTLRNAGLSSAIPLVDASGDVLLVVAVVGLPIAGINLSERRASGFRWYVVPVSGAAGSIRSLGSHTVYHSNGPGLSAVVSIGYARQGQTDPYEYAIGLPDGAVLSVKQYEFLMNLLAAAYPTGVTINTFAIRTQHVDLDGDGKADPLLPAQARTYRQFRRTRYRGEAAIGLDAGDRGL